MLLTTAPIIEGQTIQSYLGIVSAAVITILPGGNKATQRGWQTGVENVCEILERQASDLGADAVIAISMQMAGSSLCATGSAVKLVP